MRVLALSNNIALLGEPYRGNPDIPLTGTITIAAPGVLTVPGWTPVNGQRITLTTTGLLPTGLTPGTTYFVVVASGNTCQLSATSGGGSITTTGSQSGVMTVHIPFNALTVPASPFQPGYRVVGVNGTAGTLVVQDSPDGVSFNTLATLVAGEHQEFTLRDPFIRVSTAASVYLLGN